MVGGRDSLKRHLEVGGLKRLPLLLFGLGIVLVVDLQGLLLYNIKQQEMPHFCPVVASLLDGRDFCIITPGSFLYRRVLYKYMLAAQALRGVHP